MGSESRRYDDCLLNTIGPWHKRGGVRAETVGTGGTRTGLARKRERGQFEDRINLLSRPSTVCTRVRRDINVRLATTS